MGVGDKALGCELTNICMQGDNVPPAPRRRRVNASAQSEGITVITDLDSLIVVSDTSEVLRPSRLLVYVKGTAPGGWSGKTDVMFRGSMRSMKEDGCAPLLRILPLNMLVTAVIPNEAGCPHVDDGMVAAAARESWLATAHKVGR